MLSIARRTRVVAAVLVLSAAAAGCLGDDGEADESAVGAPSAAAIGGFAELERRPLELPDVEVPAATAAGRKFPRYADDCWSGRAPDPGAIVLSAIGEALLGPYPGEAKLKRGPVYVSLLRGAPRIVFLSEERRVRGSRSWAVATLWVSRPSYEGPVLVRAGRLDRAGRIGFGWGARPRDELRLRASAPWPSQPIDIPSGWRVAKIPIRVSDPGCYAFQVDGHGFSYVLPFAVF